MTHAGNDPTAGGSTAQATAALRAEFVGALSAPAATDTGSVVSGVNELPSASAVLVVKRGPNAGGRFVLDQPVTAAGRHPDSTLYLDDITLSRRHAEFRVANGHLTVIAVSNLK